MDECMYIRTYVRKRVSFVENITFMNNNSCLRGWEIVFAAVNCSLRCNPPL